MTIRDVKITLLGNVAAYMLVMMPQNVIYPLENVYTQMLHMVLVVLHLHVQEVDGEPLHRVPVLVLYFYHREMIMEKMHMDV
jgi:hypothetical protein